MSVKQRENGKWYSSVRYVDCYGEKHQKKKEGFKRKKDAKEWEEAFLTKMSGNASAMTFADLADEYLDDVQARLRPGTYTNRKSYITNRILPRWGTMKVIDITPRAVRMWQNTLLEDDGLRGSTKASINTIFSMVLEYGVKYAGLATNPVKKTRFVVPRQPKKMQIWTREQYAKFRDSIKSVEYGMIYDLMYWSGMRRGEAIGLRWGNIDMSKGIVHVRENSTQNDGPQLPKTPASERDIALPEKILEELGRYKERQYKPEPLDHLFSISVNVLTNNFRIMAKRVEGLPRIRLHDLRHSHASMLIDMGFSPQAVADRLGHTDTTMVMKVYGHMFPARRSEIAARLDEVI